MTPEPPAPGLTAGQRQALAELSSITRHSAGRVVVAAQSSRVRGNLVADVTLDLNGVTTAPGGITLERHETIRIRVPEDFPFGMPRAEATHLRWAGTPHVQFGRHLCLYASPELQWDAADGMYGYLQRLLTWLERAANGDLTELGQPLHPPIAYTMCDDVVVLRTDLAAPSRGEPWLGVALLRRVNPSRVDVVGWLPGDQALPRGEARARNVARSAGQPIARDDELLYGAAIILPGDIGFEYPLDAGDLIDKLEGQGVFRDDLDGLLAAVGHRNAELAIARSSEAGDLGPPKTLSYVLIGTPSLGISGDESRKIALVAWKMSGTYSKLIVHTGDAYRNARSLGELGLELKRRAALFLSALPVEWARVLDAREEVVTRRDAFVSAHWLAGRRVLVLGAGALGAPIVEAVWRGGAAEVTVVDRSIVTPGILVRQPYADAEIGLPKAEALVERLRGLGLPGTARPLVRDAAQVIRELDSAARAHDLIVDATANRLVRAELEQQRSRARGTWPATVTLAVGHTAQLGVACVSSPLASGGPVDILRRLSLAARLRQRDVVDEFFPHPPRADLFHPEPGCSDATFVGGYADTSGLAGQLLTGVLGYLADGEKRDDVTAFVRAGTRPMAALVVRAPTRRGTRAVLDRRPSWFVWDDDLIIADAGLQYEVRLSRAAMTAIRAQARRCHAAKGPHTETGGSLLGAFDHALRIVWVDEATGPPADSAHSPWSFVHGTRESGEYAAQRSLATGRVTQFLGMWHSHPHGVALPSETDAAAAAARAEPVPGAPRRQLRVIVGGAGLRWSQWLEGTGRPDLYADVIDRHDLRPA